MTISGTEVECLFIMPTRCYTDEACGRRARIERNQPSIKMLAPWPTACSNGYAPTGRAVRDGMLSAAGLLPRFRAL